MALEQTIEYALSEEEERDAPTLVPAPEQHQPADGPAERLTRREREVALLVERGLTNRQIGERMGLREKTVKNYTTNLLAKLGLDRRTQAAILATQMRDRSLGEEPTAGIPLR